jgi:tRNA-dihydrouridine synthase B
MAGVTDIVFRGLVRRWAPQSLICTEMISSNGMVYSKRYDAPILDKADTDQPIAFQLAAHRQEVLLQAAEAIIQSKNPDMIDLNMGCPVKKITGNFEGCALMKEPDHAHTLISALVNHLKPYNKPVTVKFRLGWDANSMNYLEFGQMCQDAGASMVTLHARTRAQGYKPGCLWDAYGELKQALKIPVVANGDIISTQDALHVINTYGVDGVMVGRGAMGRPWWIGHLHTAIQTGQAPDDLTIAQKLAVALEHATLMAQYKGELHGVRAMRGHLTDYVKGFRGASSFRSQLTNVNSLAEIETLFTQILAENSTPHAA